MIFSSKYQNQEKLPDVSSVRQENIEYVIVSKRNMMLI